MIGLSSILLSSLLLSHMNTNNFLIIGHRGAQGFVAENTLESIKYAMNIGVPMIEFDVHVCKTGEVVVLHDDTVDRTTNGTGYVRDKTLQELKSLRIDNHFTIPTLQEVLQLVNRRCVLNIELKGSNVVIPTVHILKEACKHGWHEEDFLLSSFDYNQLVIARKLLPTIRLGMLYHFVSPTYIQQAKSINAYSIGIDHVYLQPEHITAAHSAGLKIFIYTVNDREHIHHLQALGIDGVFTDYPF